MGCVTCKQCGDLLDIDKRIPEHDEGLDAYFCDCECWVSWYQKEYDRLIIEKEKWKRDCLLTQASRAICTEPSREIETMDMIYKYYIRCSYLENNDILTTLFIGSTATEVCDKRDKFLKAIGAK